MSPSAHLPLPLSGVKILLTRPKANANGPGDSPSTPDALALGLQSAGATILSWPLIETSNIAFNLPEDFPSAYNGILVTSQVAIRALYRQADFLEKKPESLDWFAVGPKSADTIKAESLQAQSDALNKIHIPKHFDALSAVEQWREAGLLKPGHRLLWPCGDLANTHLVNWLAQYQITLLPLIVYETRAIAFSKEERTQFKMVANASDCLVFTSPSAVEAYSKINPEHPQKQIAAMGASTAKAVESKWGRLDIRPQENTLEGLAKSIVTFYIANPV
ncbi:MAG: uroporphyrinogen-III synthase [Vampirovibrionales bacterium]|nr:uroporphyrinogen-III synthase [Vampirovibrionales bacterium]